ncbi:MAG: response regulator transcription factor [Chlorobiota bacterium]|jgi:two-component system LytT family response regulator|nr:response regulator transcription factor [Chlorobiota bacterium]QQS65920.1 MAG: response regulator transcription factor [Chlorobiota bacterium]
MLRAVIVDDENSGVESLKRLLKKNCQDIEVISTAGSVEEGISAIEENNPDVLFLDIELPDGSGFDILEVIEQKNMSVIFTTAHNQYAIRAIKFAALDYLMKPLNSEELIIAVKKLNDHHSKNDNRKEHIKLLQNNIRNSQGENFGKIALPSTEGFMFIEVENIIRCEAQSNYTMFYFVGGEKNLVSKTLGEFEDLLLGCNFLRVHNSHLINMKHAKKYVRGKGGFVVMTDGSMVEVSVRKKEAFIQQLSKV